MPARIGLPFAMFCTAMLALANDASAGATSPPPAGRVESTSARVPEGPASVGLRSTEPGSPAADVALNVDDSAVRYYATHNETQRMNAEIGRLKRLYPGWEPPKDPYDDSASGVEDESELWALYAADRLGELDTAINARKAAEQGWQPSPDLVQKIRRKTARFKIAEYVKQGRWLDIVDYVHNIDTADADIDVLWTVAEAFARTKQTSEAQRIYKSILTTNKNAEERLATIQKAMANMRMADVEPLIAMGVAHPDGSGEFSPIMLDITRARVSAYLHNERDQDVPEADLRAFEVFARTATDPNQAGLIGWYDYNHRDYRNALEWFKLSMAHGGDAMVAHGLAHSLRALGYAREVEEVAYAWRQPLINNAVLFIDVLQADLTREIPPYIEPERLSRYAEETLRLASGEGAQALAWYSYNSCQFDTALPWFERANAWAPKEATAYGYALTLRRLHRRKEFFDVVNRYDGLFPKVVELIFPDNLYHPPTPCDRRTAARAEGPTQAVAGVPVPQPAHFQPSELAPPTELETKRRAATVAAARPDRMPTISRADFPVAVDPENELRFAALGGAAPTISGVAEGNFAGAPLVARRVPGVGPMPYERYGFALLAAYNGRTTASAPHSALYAPAGTPWAQQMAQLGASSAIFQFAPDNRYAQPSANQQVAPSDPLRGSLSWPATPSGGTDPRPFSTSNVNNTGTQQQ
jgi:cellulose synthase operon protein C